MPDTSVPAAQSGCLQEFVLDVWVESLPAAALSLAVSALGRGLCSGKREERQSPEPVTATGLVAP